MWVVVDVGFECGWKLMAQIASQIAMCLACGLSKKLTTFSSNPILEEYVLPKMIVPKLVLNNFLKEVCVLTTSNWLIQDISYQIALSIERFFKSIFFTEQISMLCN